MPPSEDAAYRIIGALEKASGGQNRNSLFAICSF